MLYCDKVSLPCEIQGGFYSKNGDKYGSVKSTVSEDGFIRVFSGDDQVGKFLYTPGLIKVPVVRIEKNKYVSGHSFILDFDTFKTSIQNDAIFEFKFKDSTLKFVSLEKRDELYYRISINGGIVDEKTITLNPQP